MYVVAFNGSSRKNGNTEIILKKCLAKIEEAGIDTEIITVGGTGIKPCMACDACRKN